MRQEPDDKSRESGGERGIGPGETTSDDSASEGSVGEGDGLGASVDPVSDEELENFIWQTERWDPDEAERRFRNMVGAVRATAIRAAYDARVRELKYGTDPPTLDGEDQDNWYPGVQPHDRYWPALEDYLRPAWDKPDLQSLNRASDKVVARTSHPARPSFQRKGLVLGHVQAGKTSNFTAVIAKAADRNYRFFIVLSGVHNALREQTQKRLTEQLVDLNNAYWIPLTGANKDFRSPENATVYFRRVANQHVICVVKKNPTRLRALTEWLQSADPRVLAECPVIVIDDEADQAGVATATINGLIRLMLSLLPKAVYIGYTATPFANLLIDPSSKDLYPEDFILNLPKPPHHYGTEVIFGRDEVEGESDDIAPLDGYDMVRTIPVKELPHLQLGPREPIEDFQPRITATLNDAIRYFWLATAARRVRGDVGTPHSTMLIHTSVRVAVHEAFREPLETLRTGTVGRLARKDRKLQERLRRLWEDEEAKVPAALFNERPVTFDELEPLLEEVVGETRVILDNSRSKVRLNYDEGRVVAIAVGGNTLSRGLTLEGLVVSYFVRAATAYDTLLQMGRWFGYRRGYADLPRIWMTDEIRRWFRHLATVEFEMRRDIDRYEEEHLTPLDFAVRIRTHPALAITAAAKMGKAVKAYASYGGRRVPTRYFYSDDRRWLQTNISAARNLVERALCVDNGEIDDRTDGIVIIRNVAVSSVLEFLRTYQIHPDTFDFAADTVSRYIRKQNDSPDPQLLYWNVALMGGDGEEDGGLFDFGQGLEVRRIRRAKLRLGPPDYADIKTLMTQGDRVVDIPGVSRAAARKMKEGPLRDLRLADAPGLVALYPIDRVSTPDAKHRDSRVPLNAVDDVIGLGMVFPGLEGIGEVEYMSADLARLGLTADDIESDSEEDPDALPVEEG